MKVLRIILLSPLSLIYWIVTYFRNVFFELGLLKSHFFNIPVINVGNLAVGGTGKTPVVEYIIRLLEKQNLKIAYLSRGYKRNTRGYIEATLNSSAKEIGDEAFQIKSKFKNVLVAVCENRAIGAGQILKNDTSIDVIILDDAYQHRKIKPGFNILVSDFNHPFFKDYIMPSGNLRESGIGVKRADFILFTRSVKDLEVQDINPKYFGFSKNVGFTYLNYTALRSFLNEETLPIDQLSEFEILLFSGIGNAFYLESFLKTKSKKVESIKFADHHQYSKDDFNHVRTRFNSLNSNRTLIVTTEKDFSRIKNSTTENLFKTLPLYYIPIEVCIHSYSKKLFDQKILSYVGKN